MTNTVDSFVLSFSHSIPQPCTHCLYGQVYGESAFLLEQILDGLLPPSGVLVAVTRVLGYLLQGLAAIGPIQAIHGIGGTPGLGKDVTRGDVGTATDVVVG